MSIVRGFFSGVLGFLLIITLLLLGIVITINATILNPPFVLNQMDKLDVYSLATDRIKAEVKNQLALEEPYMTYLTQVVDKTAADLQGGNLTCPSLWNRSGPASSKIWGKPSRSHHCRKGYPRA